MEPMKITAYRLAKETRLDQTRISEIIHAKRSITVDTALRFSKYFGTSPEFWLNLQVHYDMEEKIKNIKNELELITPMQIVN
ncbi:MAG: HigA family addiction module antitoxin [Leptospirales bacterium]